MNRSTARFASALYGAILATSLIAAYSEDSGTDAGQIAVAVLAAALVFWLAHAYAGLLARGSEQSDDPGSPATAPSVRGDIRVALADEWPLVLGALLPVAPLLLAPIGLLSDRNAETVAIATGIALLAVGGLAVARVRRLGAAGTIVAVAASAGFGAVIIALKAFVH